MFKHDVVHPRSSRCRRETRDGEVTVGIRHVLVEKELGRAACSRNLVCISSGCQISKHSDVGDGGAVVSIAKLAGYRHGLRAVPCEGEVGDRLVHDFDFFCGRTRVKRNPSEVGVTVGAVLLQSHFGPRCSVGGIDGVTFAGPCPSDIASDLTCGKARKTGHGDEDRVVLSAGTFLERFENVLCYIHWSHGAR